MNFNFGANAQQTAQQPTGGFSFGQTAQQQQQQQPKGFSFGSSAPLGNTGFTFGAPAAATTASTGFSFGAPVTTAATGFSFGAPTTANTGFSFGAPATTTAAGFAFGGSTGSSGFTLGSGQGGAFTLGAQQQNQSASMPFGAPANTVGSTSMAFGNTSAPASTFGFGDAAAAATTQANTGFSFAATTTAAPVVNTGFNFGTANANLVQAKTSANAGFSFAPSTATTASTGFAFGGVPPTSGPAFGFGAATTQPTPQPAQPAVVNSGFGVAQPLTGFSFGTSTPASTTASSFSFGAPQITPATPSFGFGNLPASTTSVASNLTFGGQTSSTVATTAAPGLQFGVTNVSTSSSPATGLMFPSASQAVASTASGLQFCTPASTASSTVFPVAPTATATSGTAFSFPAGTTSQASSVGGIIQVAPISAGFSVASSQPGGFSFGNIAATIAGSTTAATISASSILGKTTVATSHFPTSTSLTMSAPSSVMFGDSSTSVSTCVSTLTASTAPAALTTTTTVTAASAVQHTTINFRQLEDTINKWKVELEEQEKVFINQATQVNAWDRLLVNNAEKITALNDAVERVKLDQERLDHELDFILTQQTELEDLLAPLEKSIESVPSINVQQHADLEREHTFHLAENIDAQLKRMAEDIKEIIEHMNTANKTQDENDPVQQIAKILNAHMDALHWIDHNTVALQRKLEDASKACDAQQKEREKLFKDQYNAF